MTGAERSLLGYIETVFDCGAIGEQTDRQLLETFTNGDRRGAELAFTVLVKRHGPMVFRACRAIPRDSHAAEDAFQATFLILARKAAGLWVRGSLGPWLLSVSRRVACCARTDASRQRAHERSAAALTATAKDDATWDDRDMILHEELDRLPEKYRMAVVLCDLAGLTQEQAARQLGWPGGTVRSRPARGRERLRERLTRRGMAPSLILVGQTPLVDLTTASLVEKTVQTSLPRASGQAALGPAASAIALTEGVLRIMLWSKLKATAAIVLAGAVLFGAALLGHRAIGLAQRQAASDKQRPRSGVNLEGRPGVPALSGIAPSKLDAIGKARIDVAQKLRDATQRMWQAGEIGLLDYLTVQRRYDEIVADVMVKTNADRLRYLGSQIATLKQIEDRTREMFRGGQASQRDVLTAELARLDAEYALAKASRLD
jgi:RNA polymerase sigma factor (sigma-70 family)